MLVQTLMSQLSQNEFHNLALSNDGSGSIRQTDQGRVINYINDGLWDLTNRFIFNEKCVTVMQVEDIKRYELITANAVSANDGTSYPYIRDSVEEPFLGDVLKVLAVWDGRGDNRVLNDEGAEKPIFTNIPQTLIVPKPEKDIFLGVYYQPKPILIADNPLQTELNLPEYVYPALRAYVAQKVFMSIGTGDSMRMSQEYQTQYMMYVNDLQAVDKASSTRLTTNAFSKKGWV